MDSSGTSFAVKVNNHVEHYFQTKKVHRSLLVGTARALDLLSRGKNIYFVSTQVLGLIYLPLYTGNIVITFI